MQRNIETIIAAIHDKKGQNITVIDLATVDGAIADYFVVCEGSSGRNVEAIAKNVEEKYEETARGREGYDTANWILIDYFDIMVHIFQPEYRAFYQLEDLWKDGDFSAIPNPVK